MKRVALIWIWTWRYFKRRKGKRKSCNDTISKIFKKHTSWFVQWFQWEWPLEAQILILGPQLEVMFMVVEEVRPFWSKYPLCEWTAYRLQPFWVCCPCFLLGFWGMNYQQYVPATKPGACPTFLWLKKCKPQINTFLYKWPWCFIVAIENYPRNSTLKMLLYHLKTLNRF